MPTTLEPQTAPTKSARYADHMLMLGDHMFAVALLRMAVLRVVILFGICAVAAIIVYPKSLGVSLAVLIAGTAYAGIELVVLRLKISIARRAKHE